MNVKALETSSCPSPTVTTTVVSPTDSDPAQSATVKEQKALRTTIGAMEADVEQHGLKSPAVITVGGVAKALDGSLGWDEYLAQFPPIVKEAQG